MEHLILPLCKRNIGTGAGASKRFYVALFVVTCALVQMMREKYDIPSLSRTL